MSKSKSKLSAQEQRDHPRLKQVVSQSIQAAQRELAEIERTGIWRSTHKTFEEYCFARFGFDLLNLDTESLLQLAGKASPDAAPLMRSEDEP
ncbi:MAG: hypothetical protein KME05_16455 [Gloeocapsa sp. UFS-A4-WI-NPMV-4B04]|jgi:hypothetical protein|nr:hypothetical protein [Gloeocapsa sp. UFS-A4-WI-NPMV-4B04]